MGAAAVMDKHLAPEVMKTATVGLLMAIDGLHWIKSDLET
jgi:hypothetical protein